MDGRQREWPGQHVYAYDSAGNLTYEYDSSGQTLQKTYAYTPAGLLESVTHETLQGDPESSMTWDADGNRVSFTSSTSGTWQFVYDVTAGIPAVIEEVHDGNSVYYIRESNGSLVMRIAGETVSYYHFDGLGSTKLLTNVSGAVTDKYTYDAWGSVINHVQNAGSVSQPYQYVGQLGYYTHVQDANLPLLQLGVRMYDPEIGRFGQIDPARHGASWYVYAQDLPTAAVDPSGLFPWGGLCRAIGEFLGIPCTVAGWCGIFTVFCPAPTAPPEDDCPNAWYAKCMHDCADRYVHVYNDCMWRLRKERDREKRCRDWALLDFSKCAKKCEQGYQQRQQGGVKWGDLEQTPF